MSIPEKCPLCSGGLVEGGLLDRGHYNRLTHAQWVDGELQFSLWGGLRNEERQIHRIFGLRCTACGHVLLFARPPNATTLRRS